jgi:hypothetical protein
LLNICNENKNKKSEKKIKLKKNEEKWKKKVDWLFLFVSSFLIGSFFLASD